MGDPLITVDAPKRERRRGGIKQVTGEFEPLPRLGAAANIQYISDGCDWPSLAPGLCWGTVSTGTKALNGLDVELGIVPVFAQYAGVECYLGQGADVEYAARAKRLLLDTEEHEVEAALIAWAEAGPVTATAPRLAAAIAIADEYADQKYIGLPVIIMSRFMAVIADNEGVLRRDKDTGQITTINGTPVVTSWVSAADRISVIGWPTVYASEVIANGVTNPTQNREMALAERIYAIAVDCSFRAVIEVTLQETEPTVTYVELNSDDDDGSVEKGTPFVLTATTDYPTPGPVILHQMINADVVPDTEMTRVDDQTFTAEFVAEELPGNTWTFTAEEATSGILSEPYVVTFWEPAPEIVITTNRPSGQVPVGATYTVTVMANFDYASPVKLGLQVNGGASADQGNMTATGNPRVFTKQLTVTQAAGDTLTLTASSPGYGLTSAPVSLTVIAAELEGWTVAELKQFAADHDPVIPVPSSATKAEILAIIVAYLAAHDEEP